MRNRKLIVALGALMLLLAACGGQSAEEELLEQILESGGDDIGSVEIDTDGDGSVSINVEGEDGGEVNISTDGDGDDVNITVEGDDGEEVTITGSGDDEDFTITVEGEDGGTMTFGGGEIPEDLSLPVPEGGTVITSMTMEGGASVALIFPQSAYEQLVAFYEGALPADDSVTKSEATYTDSDGDHRSTSWIGDSWMVMIDDCYGMESNALDSACVTLNEFAS